MMNNVKENIVNKTNIIEIIPEDIVCQSIKIPGVKIDTGVKIISTSITQTVVQRLSQKALTKTTTYPTIKNCYFDWNKNDQISILKRSR